MTGDTVFDRPPLLDVDAKRPVAADRQRCQTGGMAEVELRPVGHRRLAPGAVVKRDIARVAAGLIAKKPAQPGPAGDVPVAVMLTDKAFCALDLVLGQKRARGPQPVRRDIQRPEPDIGLMHVRPLPRPSLRTGRKSAGRHGS